MYRIFIVISMYIQIVGEEYNLGTSDLREEKEATPE